MAQGEARGTAARLGRELVRVLGATLLSLLGSCTGPEAAPPPAPAPTLPAAPTTRWTVDGPGAPATEPGERCEQLTSKCEPYCTDRAGPRPLDRPPALDAAQLQQLAGIVFRQTLGTRAAWLLLDAPPAGGAPELEAEVLRQLERQYRIFHREADLPAEYVRRQGAWIGYDQGYHFRYQLDFLPASRVRVWVKSTYGNWGCDFYYKVFKWEGDEWRTACVSPVSERC